MARSRRKGPRTRLDTATKVKEAATGSKRYTPPDAKMAAELRNLLDARGPDARFDLREAALWTGFSPRSLRTAAQKKKIAIAGRGPKRSPIFARDELDRFLASRGAT